MPGHHRRSPTSSALSQHFLRDESVAQRIVASTGLAPPAFVFDLGAGDGALAAAMAQRGCRVVAVELDRAMWLKLKHRFRDTPRVEVILADLLHVELPASARYSVISNVPFALTARLMRRLKELANPPVSAWLVLQEEAARKWAGLGHETVMSLLLQVRFEVEVVLALRRTDFVPRPAVDSVVLQLRRRERPVFEGPDERRFEAMVRRAFAGPNSRAAREMSFAEWVASFHTATLRGGPGGKAPRNPVQPRGLSAPALRKPRAGGRG